MEGVRVLDIATFLAAPFCGTLLAEFGAEVIKIEQPEVGDPLRRFGTASASDTGDTLIWLQESRNKKSITLDLRKAGGRRAPEAARRRVRRARRELPHRDSRAVGRRLGDVSAR